MFNRLCHLLVVLMMLSLCGQGCSGSSSSQTEIEKEREENRVAPESKSRSASSQAEIDKEIEGLFQPSVAEAQASARRLEEIGAAVIAPLKQRLQAWDEKDKVLEEKLPEICGMTGLDSPECQNGFQFQRDLWRAQMLARQVLKTIEKK